MSLNTNIKIRVIILLSFIFLLIAPTFVLAGDRGVRNSNFYILNTTPTLELKDSDASAGDVNASLSATATDTGDGTEDIDVLLKQQIGGTLTIFLNADADGSVTIGSATQNTIISGDLTVSGDDLIMGTNTLGALLVADGTNFNPVVMSGDGSIAADGSLTIDFTNRTNITWSDGLSASFIHTYSVSGTNPTITFGDGSIDIVANVSATTNEYEWVSLASDVTISGEIITATAGENLTFGQACYFKSDGKFWKTDADSYTTIKGMLAMAAATISADASGVFLIKGLARNDAWNWTVAAELFLDTTTAGGFTETLPSGSNDAIRIAGYAKGADYIWFEPDKSWYIHY